MKIIFWENIISQHKVPYWNFLSNSDKVTKFILVVEELLTENLKNQGWVNEFVPSCKAELIVNPSDSIIINILENNVSESYHFFSGIRANPMVYNAFKLSLKYPINRILLTERVNLYGFRSITRRFASLLIERKYINKYNIVLGSGSKTKEWYEECGVNSNNFYSFLYCVSRNNKHNIKIENRDYCHFIFIGRLTKLKGLDVLFKSLSKIKNLNWKLDLYGENLDNIDYSIQLQKLGIESKITFKGTKSNFEINQILNTYHTLILPSRRDGWGAVINEAIASGVRVICSDRCGASILLVKESIGNVFRSSNTNELATLLKEHINLGPNQNRSEILKYSNYLTGEAVANYLLEIIEFHYSKIGERPLPPWEKYLLDYKQKSL